MLQDLCTVFCTLCADGGHGPRFHGANLQRLAECWWWTRCECNTAVDVACKDCDSWRFHSTLVQIHSTNLRKYRTERIVRHMIKSWSVFKSYFLNSKLGDRNSSLVVFGFAVHSVAGSILLWGNFPVEGIFPLELTWVQTPFPQKLFRMRV